MNLLHSWIALLLVVVAGGYVSSVHMPFTHIDSNVHNFLVDEARLWDSINSHSNNSREKALEDIYSFFKVELSYSYGKIETVREFSPRLLQLVEEANSTRRAATYNLAYAHGAMREFAERMVNRLPRLISQTFDETKQRSFLEYIRQKSDYCQSIRVRDHSHLHNVIADFYTTIVEAVSRAYMVTQMSYMLLAITGPCKSTECSQLSR